MTHRLSSPNAPKKDEEGDNDNIDNKEVKFADNGIRHRNRKRTKKRKEKRRVGAVVSTTVDKDQNTNDDGVVVGGANDDSLREGAPQ